MEGLVPGKKIISLKKFELYKGRQLFESYFLSNSSYPCSAMYITVPFSFLILTEFHKLPCIHRLNKNSVDPDQLASEEAR